MRLLRRCESQPDSILTCIVMQGAAGMRGEEEPEEGSKAASLVSDSEEEGQVCKLTMRT